MLDQIDGNVKTSCKCAVAFNILLTFALPFQGAPGLRKSMEEIIFSYTYPRLDLEVVKLLLYYNFL